MKLWQKEGDSSTALIESFTIGLDPQFDIILAPFDITGSLAHAQMLAHTNIITASDFDQIRPVLHELFVLASKGSMIIEAGVEDIHSQVEKILVERIGTVGKKLHSGRSRNDQVLLDIKMFLRDQLSNTIELLKKLFDTLLDQADKFKTYGMPGYTHMQVAMPSSFGLWFSAYAESLIDDLCLAQAAFKNINQNPLGSAAGYGSSFPIDRLLTTELLGFDQLHINVVHAQLQRGKSELNYAYFLSSLANTINKFAYDVCVFNSQNYGFLSLPDELVTGSSIMPHKRNPDVFELIRAHSSIIQQLPAQITALISNLPSGYHRDLQLTKEVLFPSIFKMQQILEILIYSLPKFEIHTDILEDEKYADVYSVDAIYKLTQAGMAFRDAYHEISSNIKSGENLATDAYLHALIGSKDNLRLDLIREKMVRRLADCDHVHYKETIKSLVDFN